MDYGWKVHDVLCGSDHFPILQPLHDERLPHWKLNKANWEIFETLYEQKLFQDPNTIDQTKYFTETLISTILTSSHHTKWGADRQALLKLYRALVCSQLDYGIFIYRSARKFYLDPIHHEGWRLVLGAFRTSPVVSLYTEAHEAPLHLRCEKLALQYYTKLKSCPSNPASTINTNNSMNKNKKTHQTIWPSDGAYSPRICNFCYKST